MFLIRYSVEGKKFQCRWDGSPIVLGREKECPISIPVKGVSRKHLRISVEGKTIVVEDLQSANGTFYQGRPIKKEEFPLKGIRFSLPLSLGNVVEIEIVRERKKAIFFAVGIGIVLLVGIALFLPGEKPIERGEKIGEKEKTKGIPDLPPPLLYRWAEAQRKDEEFVPGALGLAIQGYTALLTTSTPFAVTAESLLPSLKEKLNERCKSLYSEALRAVYTGDLKRAKITLTRLIEEGKTYDPSWVRRGESLYKRVKEWEKE